MKATLVEVMWATQYGGISCRGARALGQAGFSSRSSRGLERRLDRCGTQVVALRRAASSWIREPVSPALASEFSTTEPQGKPRRMLFMLLSG